MFRQLITTVSAAALVVALAAPAAGQSITLGDVSLDENDGTAQVPIKNTGTATSPTTVTFYTGDPKDTAVPGSDYTSFATQLSIAPRSTQLVPVTILNNGTPEATKTITTKLVINRNGQLRDGTGKIIITDSDVAMKSCPGGVQVPEAQECPPVEPPPPPPPGGTVGEILSPTLAGLAPIASNFDLAAHLKTAPLPKTAAPDVVGAFRFICTPGQLLKDDPLVYPGQPGASHLHQFYGNTSANAHSTYQSLRAAGESTCITPLNRSAYWMPAMLDGKGNVVRPDRVMIYYKRRPKSDPKCSLSSGDPAAEGDCVNLPNGLAFIFGYDMLTEKAPTGAIYYQCVATGVTQTHEPDLEGATIGICPVGGRVTATIKAPGCWDGTRLTTANMRDHVAYAVRNRNTGIIACPTTHPKVIPGFTLTASYSIQPGDNPALWSLVSDAMKPGVKRGGTFHADFFMAWDPTIKQIWHDNCIDKLLSCSAGDLGNGQMLKGPSGLDLADPHLVPVT